MTACASTSKPVYVGRTIFIPVESSPESARVILDGKEKGLTPVTLKFSYLHDPQGAHDDETRQRILKIEKKGYEDYVFPFSIKGREYETISQPVQLNKLDNDPMNDSIDISHDEMDNTNNLSIKYREALNEIDDLKKEIVILKKKRASSEISQQHTFMETPAVEGPGYAVLTGTNIPASGRLEKATKREKESDLNDQETFQSIYTVQAGSFKKIQRAEKQFYSLMRELSIEETDFLRIEKIGKFYTVRIGKFEDYAASYRFLQALKSHQPQAFILKAYLKIDRIIKIHSGNNESKQISMKNDDTNLSDYNLGLAYGSAGRHKEAVEAFKKSLSINPDHEEIHINLGVAYDKQGMYKEAIASFKEAIKINPYNAATYVNLGITHAKANMYKEAVETLKHSISLDAYNVDAHYNLGVVYDLQSMFKEATKEFRETVTLNPRYYNAYVNLGLCYDKQGMFEDAIIAFQEAVKINPDNVKTFVNLGVSYGKSGMYKKAVSALKQAIFVDKSNADAHYNLGFAYLMLNDRIAAENEYEILKNLDTEYARRLFNEINQ